MADDFDESEVIALVESALDKGILPEQTIPLGMAQGDLFEHLWSALSYYMGAADAQMILDSLREKLHGGLSLANLKDVHRITQACTKCADVRFSMPYLPSWNLSDPDCLFISAQPSTYEDVNKLLIESFSAVDFNSSRIALTYVNRCIAKKPYDSIHIKNCLPYLHTEIELLKPKLIVTMGLIPLIALFGREFKLSEVKGTILWLGPWAILPTTSPMYALKSGENGVKAFQSDIALAHQFCYGPAN